MLWWLYPVSMGGDPGLCAAITTVCQRRGLVTLGVGWEVI